MGTIYGLKEVKCGGCQQIPHHFLEQEITTKIKAKLIFLVSFAWVDVFSLLSEIIVSFCFSTSASFSVDINSEKLLKKIAEKWFSPKIAEKNAGKKISPLRGENC